MKTILLFFVVTFSSLALKAQITGLEWVKSAGSTSYDWNRKIIVDGNDNSISIGQYQGTIDFNPNVGTQSYTSNGFFDFFIQKRAPNGDLIWARSFGGLGNDDASSVAIDSLGDIYITGFYEDTLVFNTGGQTQTLISNGGQDIYVLKLNSNGDFEWANSFGSNYALEFGEALTVDKFGDILFTGRYYGTVDFDPGPSTYNLTSNSSGQDMFIQKMNTDGDFVWCYSFNGTRSQVGQDIETDENGDIFMIGHFQGQLDFNLGTGVAIETSSQELTYDIFVLHLTKDAEFVWVKTLKGSQNNYGNAISLDENGNVIITGQYIATVDFDPGPLINEFTSGPFWGQSYNIFIEKLDPAGNLIWVVDFGGDLNDMGYDLTTDFNNDIYIVGTFQDSVDFDPGIGTYNLFSQGSPDAFMLKLDSNANLLWVNSIGDAYNDFGRSICLDSDGDIYSCGEFSGSPDFDPSVDTLYLMSNGGTDLFIQKFNQCQNFSSDEIISCNNFTWIDGVTYNQDNNSALYTTTNVNGCDSIIKLNLTIKTVDIGVTNNSPTLVANAANAYFFWIDCDSNNSLLSGEVNSSFTASSNGNYAVIINQNGCTDTSSCYLIDNLELLSNISNQGGISIFPNPSNGKLTILSKNDQILELTISKISGKLIKSMKCSVSENIILHDLSPGIYLIEYNLNSRKYQRRIVIT